MLHSSMHVSESRNENVSFHQLSPILGSGTQIKAFQTNYYLCLTWNIQRINRNKVLRLLGIREKCLENNVHQLVTASKPLSGQWLIIEYIVGKIHLKFYLIPYRILFYMMCWWLLKSSSSFFKLYVVLLLYSLTQIYFMFRQSTRLFFYQGYRY